MQNLLYFSLSFFLSLPASTHATAAPAKETKVPQPCTIRSPISGSFFDLNPLHIVRPDDKLAKTQKHVRDYSWNATGWDMPYNFTMNFCGGVVEDLHGMGGVEGVEEDVWRNVSAYYKQSGKVYSIGQQNTQPVIRGRKLVLNYTDGSPCPSISDDKRQIKPRAQLEPLDSSDFFASSKINNTDSDPDSSSSSAKATRRKNTIISLLCDRDPLNPPLTLSFVASPDECTYVFEARSSAACAGIEQAKQTLSPSGVFGVIAIIALLVYLVGGCVYSRTVLNQRGWRQLPNYALWAGTFGFFRDIFLILFSTCARCLPGGRRGGYQRVNGGIGRGRSGRDSEAENRLIDELNEEWDD